jgi:hypothetical protein
LLADNKAFFALTIVAIWNADNMYKLSWQVYSALICHDSASPVESDNHKKKLTLPVSHLYSLGEVIPCLPYMFSKFGEAVKIQQL